MVDKTKNTGRCWFWLRLAVVGALLGFGVLALAWPTIIEIIGYFNFLPRVQKLGVWAILIALGVLFSPYIKAGAIFSRKVKPGRLDGTDNGSSYIRSDEYQKDLRKNDRLGRIGFFESLCKCIVGHAADDSLVIGLYGGWGEGKTTIIHAVIDEISSNDKYIVVEFNPWHYATIDSISKAFFNDLKTKLESELGIGWGWNILGDYCQSLEFGAMGFKLGLWPHSKTTKEILEDINTKLSQTNRKLLIIIDDIDRLSPEQVVHVFELVRNSASFKNTIYLLAFDPIPVRNILPFPDFIEKIVQIAIELPAIDSHIIKRDILKFVETLPKDCLSDNSYLLGDMFDVAIGKSIKTLRQTKRYLNNLSFVLPMVYHEINVVDFMVLEVIREYYPEVYNDIFISSNIYVGIDPSSSDERERKDEERRQYVTSLLKKRDSVDDVSKALRLLGLVFPNFQKFVPGIFVYSAGGTQRVSDPNYLRKYFYMRVPDGELPDKEVAEVIGRWNNHSGKMIAADLECYCNNKAIGPLCISVDRHLHELSRELYNLLAQELCKMSLSSFRDSKKETYESMALLFDSLETRASVLMDCIDCVQDVEFLATIVSNSGGHGNQAKVHEIWAKYFDFMKRRYIDLKRDVFTEMEVAVPNPLTLWFMASCNQQEKDKKELLNYIVNFVGNSETNLLCCINALHQTGYSTKDQERIFELRGLLDIAKKILPNATRDGFGIISNFIKGHS